MAHIQTDQYYLAAWLHMKQVPLVGHVRENNRSTFEFQGIEVDQLLNEFYSETATVSIHPYTKAKQALQALLKTGHATTIKQPRNYNERKEQNWNSK